MHFGTTSGRLRNLLTVGLSVHNTGESAAQPPTELDPAQPETLLNLRHETEVHLIPTQVVFLPGGAAQPTTTEDGTPLRGSFNLFAAMGIAHQKKQTHIWTIHCASALNDGIIIDDLRSSHRQDALQMNREQRNLAMAEHAVHLKPPITDGAFLRTSNGDRAPPLEISTNCWKTTKAHQLVSAPPQERSSKPWQLKHSTSLPHTASQELLLQQSASRMHSEPTKVHSHSGLDFPK